MFLCEVVALFVSKEDITNRTKLATVRIAVILLLAFLVIAVSTFGQSLPPGFADLEVARFGFWSTDFAFAPDRRIFVTDKNGAVWLLDNDQVFLTPVLVLSVTAPAEAGLLGITLDPDFAENGFFYLYYTTGPNSLNFSGTPNNRVSRFTMDPLDPNRALPESEVILLDKIPYNEGFHNAGCVRIGNDRKLYISTGETTISSLAQDLTSLGGKILRISLDGTVPEDNPFIGEPDARPEIWAYGLRNPFRFSIDSASGNIMIGDVGDAVWEELNSGIPGANYGWPQTEGPEPAGVPGVTYPFFSYEHGGDLTGPGGGGAVIAGSFYEGDTFPFEYWGNFFFADWVRGMIWRMIFDEAGQVVSVNRFQDDRAGIVTIEEGAEGELFYLRILSGPHGEPAGDLHKIVLLETGNQPPTAKASATPTSGLLPLNVNFSSAGSSDPEGDVLQYLWDFGDGNTSSSPNHTYTYTSKGIFTVTLTVTDSQGAEGRSPPITVHAGNQAPLVDILTPASGTLYNAGDEIFYSGTANDPEDGALAAQDFTWIIVFHHDHTHTHPFLGPLQGSTNGTFTVPVTGESSADTSYEIILSVTDSEGLRQQESVVIQPQKSTFTLDTSPSGLQLLLDGTPQNTPVAIEGVVGFQRTLEAPRLQTLNGVVEGFDRWSDGGGRMHVMSTPATDTVFTAFYRPPSASLGPAQLPRSATVGSTDVSLIQLEMEAVGDGLLLNTLQIQVTGTVRPESLGDIKLWADTNRNGRSDAGEGLLAMGSLDSLGRLTFQEPPLLTIAETQIATLLITVDVPTSVQFASFSLLLPIRIDWPLPIPMGLQWALAVVALAAIVLLFRQRAAAKKPSRLVLLPACLAFVVTFWLSGCSAETTPPPASPVGTMTATISAGSIIATGVETNALVTLPAQSLEGPTITVFK